MSSEQEFERLRATFARGTTRPLAWRLAQLNGIERFLKEQTETLSKALNKDLGKSAAEAWTTEIGYTLHDISRTRKQLSRWLRPAKVSTPFILRPGRSYLQLEPLGTVLILGAWNYPLQLCLGPLIAAMSAGNSVLLKPSEISPATADLLATILPAYLDPDAVAVVNGDADVARHLLTLPFDHIFFTGSTATAKQVMRAAAEHLTPVTLELGGKSPVIVSASTNLKTAARRIIWGKLINAGQTCIAPDYVLVESSVKAALIDALLEAIQHFYGDEPQRSKDYGRIVNESHFNRLLQLLDGQTVINTCNYERGERYISPVLLDNPSADSAVMSEEIFGPILPVCEVSSVTAAIDFVRQRPKPLACYAFTEKASEQQAINAALSAGSLCFNDTLVFMLNDKLPFGGVGNSGMGRYHGEFGVRTFSHEKAVMYRGIHFDPGFRYPPFSQRKLNWLKKLF